jgi:hypothetical protein
LDIRNSYLQLRPSPVDGIGVFAIRDIQKGCRNMFSKDNGEWMKIPVKEVALLPDYAKELISNYCVYDQDYYYIPDYGFKKIDLVCFLNHSDHPNIISVQDGNSLKRLLT